MRGFLKSRAKVAWLRRVRATGAASQLLGGVHPYLAAFPCPAHPGMEMLSGPLWSHIVLTLGQWWERWACQPLGGHTGAGRRGSA